MEFTEARVKDFRWPAGKTSGHTEWDDALPGFGFRWRSAEGSKVYYAKYRMGAKQRWYKIGAVGKISLVEATKKAKAVFQSIANDIDPANEKAKAGAAAGTTFNPAYQGFLDKLERERSGSYFDANKRYLETHFKKLHGMALDSIDQATASRELKVIDRERGPIAMNRARSAGSAFFNWAWREGLCKHNPFEMTNKNEEEEDGRERTLKPKEMKAIWRHLPEEGEDYGDILRLLIFTLCRRTEIGSLRRTEVNWAERTIELPCKEKVDGRWQRRTKNGRIHIVPLTDPAFAILAKRKDGEGEYMFGRRAGPFSGWSKCKAELDERLGIAPWVHHDLRRTGDTTLGSMGVAPHEIDAILNHVSSHTSAKKGIRKKYNKYDYIDEKRAALGKYSDYLMANIIS